VTLRARTLIAINLFYFKSDIPVLYHWSNSDLKRLQPESLVSIHHWNGGMGEGREKWAKLKMMRSAFKVLSCTMQHSVS